jgi:hypothetical protein
MRCPSDVLLYPGGRSGGHHPDGSHSRPREKLVYQELGLTLLLHLAPVWEVHHVPWNLTQLSNIIEMYCVGQLCMTIGECPRPSEGACAAHRADEVNDVLLTPP